MGIASTVQAGTAPIRGFGSGFGYPFRGIRFLLQHLGLIRFWIWPILITGLCLVGVGVGVWNLHAEVINLIWEAPVGEGWWFEVKSFFHGVLSILSGLILAAVGLVLVVLIASPIAAPFNDALSQAVEKVAAGKEAPRFELGAFVRDLFRTVLFESGYLLIVLVTFIFSLVVPVVGPVVHTVFGFVLTASYWALSYIDWPAARRGLSLSQRIGLVKRRFTTMFGFGCAAWLLLFLPLINLFFMPAAVVGGTLLILDLEKDGLFEPPTQDSSPASL